MFSRRSLLRRLYSTALTGAMFPGRPEPVFAVPPRVSGRPDSPDGPLRLDTTCSAYGPSPKATVAICEALNGAGEYPDDEAERLREKIGTFHGVKVEQVVLGCGSGEILRMAAHAFTGSGRQLIMAAPTCELIGEYAVRGGAALRLVPLEKRFSHDLSAMAAACGPATGLLYICNPNNPTGTLTRRQDLEAFLASVPETAHVVVDEAYLQYVGDSCETTSLIDRAAENDRLVVVRTFSKIHSLAGLRIGYAVTTRRTAARLSFHSLERNLNVTAARAAAAALDDAGDLQRKVRSIADDRQEFLNQTHARMLRAIDSQTNFVMLDSERPVSEVVAHFQRHHIVLPAPFPPLDRHVRVSLGLPAQMREFWRVWDLMPTVGHRV